MKDRSPGWGGYIPQVLFVLILAALAGLAKPAAAAFERAAGLRALLSAASQLSAADLEIPFPCARASSVDGSSIGVALSHFTRAGALWPQKNLESIVGVAFCMKGEYGQALQAFTVGDGKAQSEWSAMQRFVLHVRQGEDTLALEDLRTVDLNATGFTALIDWVLASADPDPLFLLQEASRRFPRDAEIWRLWLRAGAQQVDAGNWRSGLRIYLGAIEFQERAGVQVGRGTFLLRIGRVYQFQAEENDPHLALSYFQWALAEGDFLQSSNQADLYLYLGSAYRSLKEEYPLERAIVAYNEALKIDSQNYWASFGLGTLYLYDLNDLFLARTYLKRAENIRDDEPNLYLLLADLYRREGNLPAARSALGQALALEPGWPAAQERLVAIRQAEMDQR